jgi:(R,R)-butanediol dehydrogenase/meso-butanediol dehydrogenase/diacetyl reductase
MDFERKTVLILGGGPIGLAVNVVLKSKGTLRVYISEPTEKRRKQNAELAEEVFDPTSEKVGERCMELTRGEGVDVVFDCAGIERAMNDGIDAVRFGGIYVNVASWVTPVSPSSYSLALDSISENLQFVIPFGPFMTKELTIKASLSYIEEDFRETVEAFCSGKLLDPSLDR